MTEHLEAAGYRKLTSTPGEEEESATATYQRNLVTPAGKKIERLEVGPTD